VLGWLVGGLWLCWVCVVCVVVCGCCVWCVWCLGVVCGCCHAFHIYIYIYIVALQFSLLTFCFCILPPPLPKHMPIYRRANYCYQHSGPITRMLGGYLKHAGQQSQIYSSSLPSCVYNDPTYHIGTIHC